MHAFTRMGCYVMFSIAFLCFVVFRRVASRLCFRVQLSLRLLVTTSALVAAQSSSATSGLATTSEVNESKNFAAIALAIGNALWFVFGAVLLLALTQLCSPL